MRDFEINVANDSVGETRTAVGNLFVERSALEIEEYCSAIDSFVERSKKEIKEGAIC